MPKPASTRPAYKMLTCIYLCRTLLFFAPYADFLKKKNQFCREVNSPWTRRLLHSVPIALSLFVAISSAAEAMAANVTEVSVSQ